MTAKPQNILLGYGVFYIGSTPIGLTRGGGQFTIEKEIRNIEADGDRGPVKGRIVQDKATPKLTINTLEVISENISKLYAGIKYTPKSDHDKNKINGKGKIELSDYNDEVKWVGKTKGGKEVVIKVLNAINLENFDWTLADKDEVVATLTYTGCYEEDSPEDFEPWEIEFAS
ncbi:hypothetical protein Cp4436_00225 [Clostridium perfringens]|uniref:hypothetical protein n=1 Tax=Clostridium perfringens TaxID=1502 RepID=UPI00244143BC|nr:hypothetical protein [Clostridium perfringens]MDG6888211.1 hypothetical protein [Clostridium perfringens]